MMKKVYICIVIISIFIISLCGKENNLVDNTIRYRIIANSDSENDQGIKWQLNTMILPEIIKGTKNTKTIDEARSILKEEELSLNQKFKDENINAVARYGQNYFPEKKYNGKTFAEGDYESLVVTIGDGQGKNWWCILFPPLCLLESDEENINNIQYTTVVQEVINSVK